MIIIFFSLVFSQGNCEEHECLKDSASLCLEILWTHSSGKSSHDKIKTYNFNHNVHSSLAFGFLYICGFLRVQQCLWMYFFLPELDLTLSGWARFLFYVFLQYKSHCQWPVNHSNDIWANNHWLSLIQITWT